MSENSLENYQFRSSRRVIWIVTLLVLISFGWAANAPLKAFVRGVGRVVPSVQTQVIQNLEGGIVREISVSEGDIVEIDQRVAKMDETQFLSSYLELREQWLALTLKRQRLVAESNFEQNSIFVPEADLQRDAPEYAASEIALFKARRHDLLSTLQALKTKAELKQQEADLLRPMVEAAAVPRIDLIRAEQEVVDAEERVNEARSQFESERSKEYSEILIKIRQIEEQINAKKDQLSRTNVVSPVRGIVNKVFATTIGGVVRSGDPLIEILPLDEVIRVEGRIAPRDIGLVFPGMAAVVKLTAFDFSIYGTLTGSVIHVGADTVVDETQRDAEPYFEVFIELDDTRLLGPEGEVEIRPGMQAEIELEAGKRTVLQYILKPLFKSSEALSEY